LQENFEEALTLRWVKQLRQPATANVSIDQEHFHFRQLGASECQVERHSRLAFAFGRASHDHGTKSVLSLQAQQARPKHSERFLEGFQVITLDEFLPQSPRQRDGGPLVLPQAQVKTPR
jgi:hypothetical protein